MLICVPNANINLLGLMIQKSYGAISSVAIKGHFEVTWCRYRIFHINRAIVFKLMPESILCDPLKFAALRREYEYIAL